MIFKKVVVSAARVKRSETLDHDFEFEMKLRLEVGWWVTYAAGNRKRETLNSMYSYAAMGPAPMRIAAS